MALIHLFYKCNQKCVFCSYPAEARPGEEGDLKAWLKQISAMKSGLVQLSGGEPMLAAFDDLIKVIAFCARKGRRVEFQTNGALLAKLEPARLGLLVKALNGAGGYFNINFPSPNAALDLKITRTRGAFSARAKAVKDLLALGATVRLTFVICSLNYKEAAKFAAFAMENFAGLSWLQFSYIKGIGRAEGSAFIPKYSAAVPYLMKALDLCGRKGLKCDVDHIPPCFLGRHSGRNVDIGKMRSGVSGPHLSEKEKVPECGGCRFTKLCPGPRKDYIAAHGYLK